MQSRTKNKLIKDVVHMCLNVHKTKFENEKFFHFKEILLLECLLIQDDAKRVLQNKNQAALSLLKEKYSITDFEDQYFNQITLLYFEKMIQNYYDLDCLSLDCLTNQNSEWTIDMQQELNLNNSKNYRSEDQQISELINLNKKIRVQSIQKYLKLQQQILKFTKNINLIEARLKAILIMSQSEKTDQTIQEELLNVQYKSKKRFLKGLEKIFKFQLDFTKRDEKIANLLNSIISTLEQQSNIYVQQLRENIFVDRVNLDVKTASRVIQSLESVNVTKTDSRGNSYTVKEEKIVDHHFSYVTSANANVNKSAICIAQNMNLENIQKNIQKFIQHLRELIDQHRTKQLNTQNEIKNLKNDPKFTQSREQARSRKKIYIGQDLQEIQDDYTKKSQNIEQKAADLKIRLDCLSYYFYPHQIYVLDLYSLISFLEQINFARGYLQIFASIVREKIKAKDRCWVNFNDRIQKFMFLNYADIAKYFILDQQLCNFILDHAVQSRAKLAFQFNAFSDKFQIKQKKLFQIIKKNFVAQRHQLTSNNQQLNNIIEQIMDQFKQQKQTNFSNCQLSKTGCLEKPKYYVTKIIQDLISKPFRNVIYFPIDNYGQMRKFIFEVDMKPGSNLEFYLRYLSLGLLQKQKKRCCRCCCC